MRPSWPASGTGSQRPGDTAAESLRVQLEILRRLGPDRRLDIAMRMSDEVREIAMAGIASRHPEYSKQQVRWALFRKLLGEDLFRAAYPSADLLEP